MPASHSASASSSSGVRETNAPRNAGIAQNAQRRSQPLASFSEATGPVSSRRRSTVRRWAGVCSSTVGACPGTHHRGGAAGDRGQRQQLAPVARGVRVDRLAGQHRVEPGGDVGVVVEAEHRLRPRAGCRPARAPYRSAMHPAATTLAPVSAAASSVSIESCLAFSTKPQVLTSTTSAPVAVGGDLPAAGVQPGGQLLGVDLVAGAAQGEQGDAAAAGVVEEVADTIRGYRAAHRSGSPPRSVRQPRPRRSRRAGRGGTPRCRRARPSRTA